MTQKPHKPDLYALFEQGLKQGVPEDGVNYKEIEKKLMARISGGMEKEGLRHLKNHDPSAAVDWDSFENRLFRRIAEYEEYDQPIDEQIKAGEDLPESQWDRLEEKVDEDILRASGLSDWEKHLKADELMTQGKWEEVEASLSGKVDEAAELPEWAQSVMAEERLGGPVEKEDEDWELSRNRPPEPWEEILKTDLAVPEGRMDKVEKRLFRQIVQYEHAKSQSSLWLTFGWFSHVNIAAKAALLLAAAVLTGWLGLSQYRQINGSIPTVVYRTQGDFPGALERIHFSGSRLEAPQGCMLTLVNQRGYVDVQNGPEISIDKATRKSVRYSMKPGDGVSGKSGSATFFVNKAEGRQDFSVATPDYHINVLGTYFRVQSDLNGRLSTHVMEGRVRITRRDGSEQVLSAGQSFSYTADGYQVSGNGRVLHRSSIRQLPEAGEMAFFSELKISSAVPAADVRLNGEYLGQTPLTILYPPGEYNLKLKKNGFAERDTSFVLGGLDLNILMDLAPMPELGPETAAAGPVPKHRKAAPVHSEKPGKAAKPAEAHPVREIAGRRLSMAEQLEEKQWNSALTIYREVIGDPSSSRLEKESAHYSIARLQGRHHKDKAEAIGSYMQYLALYPAGAFAGEAWLRLAELELERNPEKSIEYYNRFFEKYPNHPRRPELQHRVGLIYLQMKKYTRAIESFEEALANSPSPELRRHILTSYHQGLMAGGDVKKAEVVGKMLEVE